MALLEYAQTTLARGTFAPLSSLSSQRNGWAELRGGQVLAAHMCALIRDASTLRCPTLNAMKVFIAQRGSLMSSTAEGTAEDEAILSPTTLTATAALPDWVGGDAATMAPVLLTYLQDTQEKTHRLALDVLLTVCPLAPAHRGYASSSPHLSAAAFADGNTRKLTSGLVGVAPPPCCNSGAIISYEVKSLLVAAAVQLLGTRYGTPGVAWCIFQWLTVNPGARGCANENPGTDDDPSPKAYGGKHHCDALNASASSPLA
ncbi:hypothetical_protein [Leishmania braziliensis MHOM/BR/75/M2904]|uniref:Hypothetical_protein n=1 Tax=Leishmania braziliensis MHOM/BR/75/M2904 TaxID=420245 RepID=A0A3P3ZFG9_LEIBR|nr:unnamed protein product [Leishmania braziliensis]SYZ68875.1 hypothetical_protein [Leishmania braziliensis MHOM/BR/75/M2904]